MKLNLIKLALPLLLGLSLTLSAQQQFNPEKISNLRGFIDFIRLNDYAFTDAGLIL